MKQIRIYLLLAALLSLAACTSKPRRIVSNNEKQAVKAETGIFTKSNSEAKAPQTEVPSMKDLFPVSSDEGAMQNELHKVKALEVLPTQKYVYVRVREEGDEFWIAARKQPIKTGENYYYRSGLLKTNFESKEYQRIFDRIYLVSKLVSENHGHKVMPKGEKEVKDAEPHTHTGANSRKGDFMTIKALSRSPKDFEGQSIKLKGKVTKINSNIMKRNWIHLQDGTANDFDLVITTTHHFQVGQEVALRAKVSLNKDFGSGYFYELILENGHPLGL